MKRLLLAAAALATFPATAQTVAVTNARLVVGDGAASITATASSGFHWSFHTSWNVLVWR